LSLRSHRITIAKYFDNRGADCGDQEGRQEDSEEIEQKREQEREQEDEQGSEQEVATQERQQGQQIAHVKQGHQDQSEKIKEDPSIE